MKSLWEEKKLGYVCSVIAGQSPEGKYYNTNSDGLPFYQGKKEFRDKYIGEPTKWTTKVTKEAIDGDILMSVRAPVGPVNFATQKICIGRGLAAIRATDSIDKDYLFYFFIKHKNELVGNEGAVFNSINKTQIENLKIPLPPISNQKRIVKILDKAFAAIDKAKTNAEKNLQNSRELFDSYLNKIFANPGDDWEEKRLGEVCYNVQYGTSKKASKMGETPVIRIGNVQDGEIILNDLVFTDDQEDISKYSLQKDDVLFNRTNSAELVGKSAIYKGERPAIFAGYLIRINRKTDLIDGDYLNYYLNSSKTREYGFSVMTSSVNQANINGTKLKEYLIPVPSSIDKQLLIVEYLDKLKEKTKSLETIYQQKLADLEELRKSILQKAFDGEL